MRQRELSTDQLSSREIQRRLAMATGSIREVRSLKKVETTRGSGNDMRQPAILNHDCIAVPKIDCRQIARSRRATVVEVNSRAQMKNERQRSNCSHCSAGGGVKWKLESLVTRPSKSSASICSESPSVPNRGSRLAGLFSMRKTGVQITRCCAAGAQQRELSQCKQSTHRSPGREPRAASPRWLRVHCPAAGARFARPAERRPPLLWLRLACRIPRWWRVHNPSV